MSDSNSVFVIVTERPGEGVVGEYAFSLLDSTIDPISALKNAAQVYYREHWQDIDNEIGSDAFNWGDLANSLTDTDLEPFGLRWAKAVSADARSHDEDLIENYDFEGKYDND